ncbi:MAG: ATP-binding protein [Cyclobacteriaceae bacterium]
MDKKENFKISSALKDHIGKDLITDEFIAFQEIIKNSFDANATDVKIVFESKAKSIYKIVIVDNGDGMNEYDLKNKWLFVAYSEKNKKQSYRDKITKRSLAGAKGLGRFSCDRLGSALNLISIKNEKKALIENLFIDWTKFEKDDKKEFYEIEVDHRVLPKISYPIKHGTVLEITQLRDDWNFESLLKLKQTLQKLINPIQENDSENFAIEIICEDEKINDKKRTREQNINGPVRNFLFESLKIKTPIIVSEISKDGKFITTTLRDKDRLIYKIKEGNPYKNVFNILPLNNIKIHLFQLNRAAKLEFHKTMGMHAVEYGDVFLYKNGFRIYPFGEPGSDIFLIDRRKAQGRARYLGNRDLIGRVEINGTENDFKETSSRDGGLIKNKSFYALNDFFFEKVLRRFEKYVVDVIKWGDPYKENENDTERKPAKNVDDVKTDIFEIISNLTNSKEILEVEYDKDFLNIIDEKQEKSATKLLKNISRIAEKTNNPRLKKEAALAERRLKELTKAKDEAEKHYTKEIEQREKQSLFLQSVVSQDLSNVTNLLHQIIVSSDTIDLAIKNISYDIAKGKTISKTELLNFIDKVSYENKKISGISKFTTRANFKDATNNITADLSSYIEQYVQILKGFTSDIKIFFEDKTEKEFRISFTPIEISIIVDNIVSNALKQDAAKLKIELSSSKKNDILFLRFTDNGKGLHRDISDVKTIFEKGITTTKGSGLGLYHIANIVKRMKGDVAVTSSQKNNFELLITFYK